MEKTQLRKKMGALRASLSEEEIRIAENRVIEIFTASELYQTHEWFYPFVSYRKEFPTHSLIERMLADGKHVAVPKVMGEEMKFYEIQSMDDLSPGCMGILEPEDCGQDATAKGVILLPGLAFDKKGGRMGYGGGFYDKYLERYPYHLKIGLLYDLQLVEEVPSEEHDLPVDYLLSSDLGIYPCI